ncbi:unnamed protein product [Ambrosiozyma monospora]|uniref:Unnamed protein product n=1 Tax=Ambrosiozyma monospora TaxID=43982 RepID=A0ACB5TB73_AMBMO|nr:unnamed protein product [Ambrosiozyma monospora]
MKRYYWNDEDLMNVFLNDQCLPRIRRTAGRFGLQGKEYLFYDLCQLCLFDIYFYIDNSGSMGAGKRLEQLQTFLQLFIKVNPSTQPLRLKIMNNHAQIAELCRSQFGIDLNCITTEEQLDMVFNVMSIAGVTPLASQLYDLIIKPEVLQKPYLVKPMLIVMFTDGAPYRDSKTLENVILQTQSHLAKHGMSKKSVSYQIAQIGDDREASAYLDSLDNNRTIGDVIDCTSPIEKEMSQMARKNRELSNEVNYVKKLLLGAIDMTYDSMDEVHHQVY